ncbi:hypothetical protein Cri9333_2818 [Crinalium epipsammum PCC 9333]|uniref:Uncharacterized protein n=1 Tax=Crinalium epipsammum PCC 9333 TaxID=1173022 RepID=K9W1I9_9CYAN|nr:hypothetical protein [Crinalium epipsammum]AFZ13664.1 hypothetical protein Cri9333_2818 [Crinalium epipsammum PCC 9333]
MAKKLTAFIDPRTLKPTLSDISQAVKKPAEKLSTPTDKQWKWATIFYAVIEGEGAIFGSYRRLSVWVEAVINLLNSCNDWQTLEEIIASTEAELEHYRYRDEHKQQLQEVLTLAATRLQELKQKAAGLIKAWNWARGWEAILRACGNEESLNIAVQLYKAQRQQFSDYPDAIANVIHSGKQHRQHLRSSINSLI